MSMCLVDSLAAVESMLNSVYFKLQLSSMVGHVLLDVQQKCKMLCALASIMVMLGWTFGYVIYMVNKRAQSLWYILCTKTSYWCVDIS